MEFTPSADMTRETSEDKAQALFALCAHYLAQISDGEHRRAIIKEASTHLGYLVTENERARAELVQFEAAGGPLSADEIRRLGTKLDLPPDAKQH